MVIYRPPTFYGVFIQEFSDLLGLILPKFYKPLIIGEFNIHICCANYLLAKDFLDVIDSYNLTQSVHGPTHEHGHTLDLVIFYGLPVSIIEICECWISDHLPVLLRSTVSSMVNEPFLTAGQRCVITPFLTALKPLDCIVSRIPVLPQIERNY